MPLGVQKCGLSLSLSKFNFDLNPHGNSEHPPHGLTIMLSDSQIPRHLL